MSIEEQQVRKFYNLIWNKHEISLIPSVLDESFIFRGSLGDEKLGHDGFVEYLDKIHSALGNYQCIIVETASGREKLFAKIQFTGVHKGTFLDIEATGRQVTWDGAALFHFKNGKVSNLWVLGDLKSLEAQLNKT